MSTLFRARWAQWKAVSMRVLTYFLEWALILPFLFQCEVITQAHWLHDPELKVIYRFVCALFSAEHLTAECAIVTLVRQFFQRLLVCPVHRLWSCFANQSRFLK